MRYSPLRAYFGVHTWHRKFKCDNFRYDLPSKISQSRISHTVTHKQTPLLNICTWGERARAPIDGHSAFAPVAPVMFRSAASSTCAWCFCRQQVCPSFNLHLYSRKRRVYHNHRANRRSRLLRMGFRETNQHRFWQCRDDGCRSCKTLLVGGIRACILCVCETCMFMIVVNLVENLTPQLAFL